ncbi:MAG: hypothetical protein D6702_07315 [Planctomycetota bacterium]|nr:MAG: hypothetical protein D6702_07315 [Planctomycetota bacterium]
MNPTGGLVLLLLAVPACANAWRSRVHDHDAIGLRGLAADTLVTDRPDPRRTDRRLQGVSASGWEVGFEHWLDAGTSAGFGLARRSYPTAAAGARSLELRTRLRESFLEEARTQPYLEAGTVVAALDLAGTDGLSFGLGLLAGAGLRHFPSRSVALEAGATFLALTVDPRTVEGPKGTRFRSEEELYGWEFALQLAFLF